MLIHIYFCWSLVTLSLCASSNGKEKIKKKEKQKRHVSPSRDLTRRDPFSPPGSLHRSLVTSRSLLKIEHIVLYARYVLYIIYKESLTYTLFLTTLGNLHNVHQQQSALGNYHTQKILLGFPVGKKKEGRGLSSTSSINSLPDRTEGLTENPDGLDDTRRIHGPERRSYREGGRP